MCSKQQPDSCASTNVKNYFLTCTFGFHSNAGGRGGGAGDVPGCLQLHRLHNHPVSCIDSCVSKASPPSFPASLPPHRFGPALSDVEDPQPALKDGGGVRRELGPHQIFLSRERNRGVGSEQRSETEPEVAAVTPRLPPPPP